MNYECIKDFTAAKTKEEYKKEMRISEDELFSLKPEEQKNFEALKGESWTDELRERIEREDHLENE